MYQALVLSKGGRIKKFGKGSHWKKVKDYIGGLNRNVDPNDLNRFDKWIRRRTIRQLEESQAFFRESFEYMMKSTKEAMEKNTLILK